MPKNFERLLKERKTNILQVSRETHIANSTLYMWKADKTSLTAKNLDILAEHFNVSVDFLLDKTVDPTPMKNLVEEYNKAIQSMLPQHPSSKIQTIYNNLTEDNQHMLLEFADFLLSKQNKNRP